MVYLIFILFSLRPFLNERLMPVMAALFAATCCALIGLWLASHRQIRGEIPWYIGAAVLPLALGVSAIHSVNPGASMQAATMMAVNALAFLFIALQPQTARRRLCMMLAIAGACICVKTLVQFTVEIPAAWNMYAGQLEQDGLYYTLEVLRQGRAFAYFFSPACLAGYLVLLIFFSAGFSAQAWQQRDRRRSMLLAILTLAALASLGCTKSVGAILSVFAGGIIWAALSVRVPAKVKIIFFSLCLIMLLIVFGSRMKFFIDSQNPENSYMQRGRYWQSSLAMIGQRPWSGWGADTFRFIYPQFKIPAANETSYAHNIALQLWAESGLPAVAALLLLGALIFSYRKTWTLSQTGIFCACSAFLIYNCIDYSFFVPQTAFFWWLLAAMLLPELPPAAPSPQPNYAGKSALIVCILLTIYFLRDYRAQTYIEAGQAMLKRGNADAAGAAFEKAAQTAPEQDYPYYLTAVALQQQEPDFSHKVEGNYQKAIQRNPHYAYYYYYLGMYYAFYEKNLQSQHELIKALTYYPANPVFEQQLTGR